MPLISMTDIHKYYHYRQPAQVHALKGVSLEVEQGEMLAVMGRSGSGKSTLLHIIGCLDDYQQGTYLLDGEDAGSQSDDQLAAWRNKKIGFVLQDFGLILSKTAYENVAVPLLFDRATPHRDISPRVEEALELVGLADKRSSLVNQLSGGQKQRVAIARAMVSRPLLLIADEPTGALDTATSAEILELMTSLNQRGVTILMATHAPEVADYCTRRIVISDGMIQQGDEG